MTTQEEQRLLQCVAQAKRYADGPQGNTYALGYLWGCVEIIVTDSQAVRLGSPTALRPI